MARKEPWALVESSKRWCEGRVVPVFASATKKEEGIGGLSALVVTCRGT
jgi:hypothetical protein